MGRNVKYSVAPFFLSLEVYKMAKINFKCEQMRDLAKEADFEKLFHLRFYYCSKRGSVFTRISDHCYDCPKYQEMLDQVCKILED